MTSMTTSSSTQPSSAAPPTRIRILTLNCWGLKFLSKFRHERLSEIGRQIALAVNPPEIIGLQECWTQQDYRSIRQQTKHLLPYGKFYFNGVFGGGLAILSKWPIEESNMFSYPLNGRPTAFFRGDWYVGKGVACARIRLGPGLKDVAEVFCTHLHAPYEQEPHDTYLCHRTAQAWEIAKLMRGAAERGHLVIGLGDFNMVPLSFAHRLITAHAPVHDVWRVLHPDSSVGGPESPQEKARGKPLPTAEFNIQENGASCDGPFNTWRWPKEHQKQLEKGRDRVIDPQSIDKRGRRLDYIFVGDGASFSRFETNLKWTVESAEVALMQRHPTLRCSLSDHFGVEAVITRLPSATAASTNTALQEQLLEASSSTATDAPLPPDEPSHFSTLVETSPSLLTPETYTEILALTQKYQLRERSQRRWRLYHFIFSIIFSIGCFVAIWWTSPVIYVAFILLVLSTLGFAGGVLDGLIGGLFMSWELRALKEFEWEIRTVRKIAARVQKGNIQGQGQSQDDEIEDSEDEGKV